MNETERTVLRSYGDGMTVREISNQIGISTGMVRQYLRTNGVRKSKIVFLLAASPVLQSTGLIRFGNRHRKAAESV